VCVLCGHAARGWRWLIGVATGLIARCQPGREEDGCTAEAGLGWRAEQSRAGQINGAGGLAGTGGRVVRPHLAAGLLVLSKFAHDYGMYRTVPQRRYVLIWAGRQAGWQPEGQRHGIGIFVQVGESAKMNEYIKQKMMAICTAWTRALLAAFQTVDRWRVSIGLDCNRDSWTAPLMTSRRDNLQEGWAKPLRTARRIRSLLMPVC
jgi:hypothetical protein